MMSESPEVAAWRAARRWGGYGYPYLNRGWVEI